MATAFAVVVPFFFFGIPSGHDFEFHLNSWMEVSRQWKLGVVYPRWAALAHYGYGEARFVFYPPASWMLGACLGMMLPWQVVPGAYVWVALTLSGCSMFLLARRWLSRRDAIFAAALYAANPYYLVIVYWRSAFAELLAGALFPLLLLFVLRLEEEGQKAAVALGLVVAAAWLTNAPSAVMVNYSVALLIVMLALIRRKPRLLGLGAFAILLGAALAAFYIFPAVYEEKWVDIAQVLSEGVRPQDNFLFTLMNDVDHNHFNYLVSLVACAELAVLAGAIFLSREQRRIRLQVWWTLVAWVGAAAVLMLPITFPAWEYLPKLRFVQLPWRWLLCLNVTFALLITMAWRRWLLRGLVCVVMLAVLVVGWRSIQPPWWDKTADISQMQRDLQDGAGYEGTDEYVPVDGDPYEIKRDAPRVLFESEAKGMARIHIQQWDPEARAFTANVSEPGNLVLRLFNYPAWQVEINGETVSADTMEVTGQLVMPVAVGESRVRITFLRTWDRTAGGIVSAIAALFLGCGVGWQWKNRRGGQRVRVGVA
jgi:hypothetical protein